MSTIRRYVKEPFPGLSHLFGAILSVFALVSLLDAAKGRPLYIVGFGIYGVSLVLLYLASAAAHSIHCKTKEQSQRLDRLDYMAIFLLIAGTYTPLCLFALKGAWGWGLLIAVWLLAAFGIVLIMRGRGRSNWPRTILYLAMGWLVLIGAAPLARALEPAAIAWLLAGGAFYTLGAVVFATDRPHLWPGKFAAHDLWHVMALAGSACHFLVIRLFVAPA